ncbi:hypothetical protein LCGC14_0282110 [marine sediment metagenome]|uniref:Uncharacterized protein n=1 Tax=marine sediment metagenome TaxID=412755 RepID=A0A0F9UCC6_9ZZZZ
MNAKVLEFKPSAAKNAISREPAASNEKNSIKLSDEDREKVINAAQGIREVFKSLGDAPLAKNSKSPGGEGPSVGPYNMPISYTPTGKPIHMAGQFIDKLKELRRFAENSIELRCDALGLVVYVSGVNQVTSNTTVQGCRVVAYDFDKLEPTVNVILRNHVELTNKLFMTLVSTYNRLSRTYNIAGLQHEWLALKSDHAGMPTIPLITVAG